MFSCKFAAYFRTSLYKKTYRELLLIGIPVGSNTNLLLHFYENKWMSETKKNDLIKARKHCKIFKFIETLNFVEDGGKFKTNYCM